MFRRKSRRNDRTLELLKAYRQYQQFDTHRVSQPTRAPSMSSDYLVPLAHGLTAGVLVSLLAVVLTKHYGDPKSSLWLIWFEYFLGASVVAYLGSTFAIWKLLWSAFETLVNRDLDRDGKIGDRPILRRGPDTVNKGLGRKAAQAVSEVQPEDPDVESDVPDGILTPRELATRFPMTAHENALQWFVRVAAVTNTSARQWEPILGRQRYQSYRDALIEGNHARWNSYDDKDRPRPTAGWSLVRDAEEICNQISNL